MRKLASIQTIIDIQSIPNADSIEVATILGWQVIVKKNTFEIGNKVVYCEIDSILPDWPEFEFLRKFNFRIKTIKLRKQISQGICFPISILKNRRYKTDIREDLAYDFHEGDNVTELLNITKYEQPECFNLGTILRNFPSYVIRTDEVRIQSFLKLLKEFQNKICYITVKIDGTSSTFCRQNDKYDICSRNVSKKQSDDCVYWKVYKKYNIEDILKEVGNIAIQGEIAGPSIQGNHLNLKELQLFVFNIFDINKQIYFDYENFIKFCKQYNLQTVPILENNILFDFTLKQLLEMAKGNYPNVNHPREGIVIRPTKESYSEVLKGRLSVKVINNDYLLKGL